MKSFAYIMHHFESTEIPAVIFPRLKKQNQKPILFILGAAQLFKLLNKYKAELFTLSFLPEENLLLVVAAPLCYCLFWIQSHRSRPDGHTFTPMMFALRNSLTPAGRFVTKHWQLRFHAIYEGKHIHRKYKV